MAAIRDPVTRHMYEIQILEFGQIPRKLFSKQHPERFAGLIPTPLPPSSSLSILTLSEEEKDGVEDRSELKSQGRLFDLQLDNVFQGHKKSVTGVTLMTINGDAHAVSVSLDGFLKVYK